MGFQITEKMEGKHSFLPGKGPRGEHSISFEAHWGPESLGSWLSPFNAKFLTCPLAGTITAGELCHETPIEGTLALKYFSQSKIIYDFTFDVDSTAYSFYGEKVNIRPWNVHRTHTTLYGEIKNEENDEVISESILYFYLSNLPSMLFSFQLS